jgi:hypothetical protein
MAGHDETVCGCMPPGHHRFNATAVLVAVNALRVTSALHGRALAFASTPRSAGLQALTAPPRSADGGAYMMAG